MPQEKTDLQDADTNRAVVHCRKIPIDQAEPGMVLADHIRNSSGGVLLGPDTILSSKAIERLKEIGVYSIYIEKAPRPKEFDIFTGKKAVVVDDSLFFRHMLSKMLYKMGFFVCEELDAADGVVKIAREKKPDLIMMDIHLPGISGVEGIKRVATSMPHVKIIAVSTDKSKETVIGAVKAGACDFVVKPIDWEMVKACVTRAFSSPGAVKNNGSVN